MAGKRLESWFEVKRGTQTPAFHDKVLCLTHPFTNLVTVAVYSPDSKGISVKVDTVSPSSITKTFCRKNMISQKFGLKVKSYSRPLL